MPDHANHAIRDGNYPIVYIAADGGLYKYFPDSGEVHLMKSVEAGEQGLMVGYAALTKKAAIAGILELVVMPIQYVGLTDQDWIHHFVPGDGWLKKVPPAPNKGWSDVSISGLNPNNWVCYTDHDREWGSQEIYVSSNNGASWIRVPMAEHGRGMGTSFAGWSTHAPDFLWIAGRASVTDAEGYAEVWYGNPFTSELQRVQLTTPRRHSRTQGVAIMENGTLVVRGHDGGSLDQTWPVFNVEPDGTLLTIGPGIPQAGQQIIGLIGTNNILAVAGGEHALFRALHYNVANMTDTGLDLAIPADPFNVPGTGSRGYIDVLTGMRWFIGRPSPNNLGIRELTDPMASPSVLPSYGAGFPVGSVRADNQSRTTLAAMSKRTGQGVGQALFYVFKDGAWVDMVGPEDAYPNGMSQFALEPIVRPEA